MTPADQNTLEGLSERVDSYETLHGQLPGIADPAARETLLRQMIESLRRVRYVQTILDRDISPRRSDPQEEMFDPIMAAVLAHRGGDVEEACWLVFLFVHFGRHPTGRYRYVSDVYGRLGEPPPRWGWAEVSSDSEAFRDWLRDNQTEIRESELAGGFGNHRKYQSLDADIANGTGAAVTSYVDWVLDHGSHQQLIDDAVESTSNNPRETFGVLYNSMTKVASFGRLARFDYVAMLGKLGLAQVEPGSVYLAGASGPTAGARLLFVNAEGPSLSTSELEAQLAPVEI